MDADLIYLQLEALHADALSWTAACCGGDAHRGADVLQLAYVKVASGKVRFSGRSAFKTWWFGVLRLTVFEEARRVRSWFAFLERWGREPAPGFFEAPPSDSGDAHDEQAALDAALARLPARQREVIHLVFHQQLTLVQAADVMGISPGSARQHYERAKKSLRVALPILCRENAA